MLLLPLHQQPNFNSPNPPPHLDSVYLMDGHFQMIALKDEFSDYSSTGSPMEGLISLPDAAAAENEPEPFHHVPSAMEQQNELSPLNSDISDPVEDIVAVTSPSTSATAAAAAAAASATGGTDGRPVKRGRGRPPKYPKFLRDPDAKPLKKRSKDGCITCRRRKKKCDETKPTCLICERSNNICEGYGATSEAAVSSKSSDSKSASTPDSLPEPVKREAPASMEVAAAASWDSQAEEAVKRLPRNIHGVENEADRLLLEHYPKLSCILNLPDNFATPFSEILLDMALNNQGLMHSILYLSGSHLAGTSNTYDQSSRHWHHLDCALRELNMHQKLANHFCDVDDHTVDDCTVAQALVIFLSSVMTGQKNGEYRHHMEAAKHLLTCQRSHNEQFQQLSTDFLAYYDFSRNLTCSGRSSPVLSWTAFRIPSFVQREAGTFFGVLNVLFTFMSKITIIRDHIRERRKNNLQPYSEDSMRMEARKVELDIRNWRIPSTGKPSHDRISELYRQCCNVYLYRTILDSAPCRQISEAVDVGLEYLQQLGSDQSVQGILLTPIFILGCAAFEPRQRHEIEVAIDTLKKCRGGGNIAPAKAVMDNVWWTADLGLEGKSWDWDFAMERLGMDFIVA